MVLVALLLHVLPFATRPALIGGDEPHYALAASSLATDFDLDLHDDYAEVSQGSPAAGKKLTGRDLDHHTVEVNGRLVFAHPIGLPMLFAPLLAVLHFIAPSAAPDVLLGVLGLALTFSALLAGWRLLLRLTGSAATASWLTFGVYFCSPLWFYSRTFFTEPYSWSFAVLAISALARRRLILAGLFLALTLAMKETALFLVIPILLASVALQGLRVAALATLGPAVFGLVFMVKNVWLTGQLISTFQPFQYGGLVTGSAGLLFDPARGLVWFAPLLAASTVGWVLPPLSRRGAWLGVCSFLAFLSYFLLTASWIDWRGGSGYATRLLLPALPALAVPMHRLSQSLRTKTPGLLAGLATVGFAIQVCAAVDPVPAFWSATVMALVTDKPIPFLAGAACSVFFLSRLRLGWLPEKGKGEPS